MSQRYIMYSTGDSFTVDDKEHEMPPIHFTIENQAKKFLNFLNNKQQENKKLEKELLEINKHLYDNEFEFTVTENRVELFKDELYIKDAHTRVEMIKGRRLKITVYPPNHPPMTFCYHITGKTFFH